MTDLRNLMTAIFHGDADTIHTAMGPNPVVQDQRLGRLEGAAEITKWVVDSAAWLRKLNAVSTELAFLKTDRRTVLELSLAIKVGDDLVDLPYVLVADHGEQGITELRTYHSTWPYTGEHVFRPPPLAGHTPEPMPEIFQWYIDRVKAADAAAVLDRFTTDGYVREPSGDRWKHEGPEARATFYGHLEHAPRAQFELMTSTVDAELIAVEYAFAYGDTELVGGICIMEVVEDQIAAVRITDDVSV